METTFDNKCAILSAIWMEHRNDTGLEEFIRYNDLGLPLAYAIDNGIITKTSQVDDFISEAFGNLLDLFDVSDSGWNTLDEFWQTLDDISGR